MIAYTAIERLTAATPELRAEQDATRAHLREHYLATCASAFDFLCGLNAFSTDEFRFGLEYVQDNDSFAFFPIHKTEKADAEMAEVSR